MLQFNDIKSVLFNSNSARYFKYWSEVLIDFLLMAMFLLVILSWQSIFYSESAGLLCVYTNKNNFELAISEGRYMSSRCLVESNAKLSLFYPYFEFLQFILILLTQVMWLNIPKVKSKLDSYFELLNKIQEIEPNFEKCDVNMVPRVIIDPSKEEDTNLIHDKLIFLITDESYIAKYYFIKTTVSLFVTITFLCANILWIYLVISSGVDFECNLAKIKDQYKFDPIACNVSPYYFFFGYIFLFQCLLFAILCLSLVNFIYFADVKQFKQNAHDLLGAGGDRLCGLPGFLDFALYLSMLKLNVKDGGFYLQMIKFVINTHANENESREKNVVSSQSENKKIQNFSLELCITSEISEKLCMEFRLKPFTINHLYDCIREMMVSNKRYDLFVNRDFKKELIDELRANSLYYAYLYSGLVDNDVNQVRKILINFEQYICDVESETAWPNNIFLAAAANIFNVRIVLVKTFPKQENYVDKISVFDPHMGLKPKKVVIFCLIYPHYYNVLLPIPISDSAILEMRNRFATSPEFRQKIIDRAHQAAVKRLLQEDSKNHRKTKSNLNFNKQEAEVKVYQDTFSNNYQTQRNITNRFRIVKFNAANDTINYETKI